ncbi:MAG: GNAT family N-acetyltransferase [Clostridia bacterium]
MEIRKAKEDDCDRLIILLKQIATIHYQKRPDIFKENAIKYKASELALLLKDESRPIFVATEDNKVIGYAFLQINLVKNSSMLCDRKALYLDDLCVDENLRGNGYGKKLFSFVKNYAKEIGCVSIDLNVWELNDMAISFYEKCGMSIQKRHMELTL